MLNVEECGSTVARAIAFGAENVAKGILWCGVITVNKLHRANEVSPEMLGHIKMLHVRICDYLLMVNLKIVVKMQPAWNSRKKGISNKEISWFSARLLATVADGEHCYGCCTVAGFGHAAGAPSDWCGCLCSESVVSTGSQVPLLIL
ncbi:uncharacterized protein [Triticum aestivum]|uniref:uncharacterized protein n=1 Tax=Triticum aestivum TaxID=4565 RepID=UPI001D01EC97|nr:uncharacterized protein LOC123042717 [Triticum aestivum]XP_044446891.1 uncharacterized protein LOC123176957 [Triticum aestivum]